MVWLNDNLAAAADKGADYSQRTIVQEASSPSTVCTPFSPASSVERDRQTVRIYDAFLAEHSPTSRTSMR